MSSRVIFAHIMLHDIWMKITMCAQRGWEFPTLGID